MNDKDKLKQIDALHQDGCYLDNGRYFYGTCPTCKVSYPCPTAKVIDSSARSYRDESYDSSRW